MRTDAVAAAHARLRRLIIRGAIAPGSELSQVELARRVGVSTTPLREALRRLEAEGLVDSRHNRRPRVRPLDVEELDSIYAARIMLEGLALRLTVPAMADEQLTRLHETIVDDGVRQEPPWQRHRPLRGGARGLPRGARRRRGPAAQGADRQSDGTRRPLHPPRDPR